MFVKMLKTNGEPYTRRLVRTVWGQALGNLPLQDGKAPGAEPTLYEYIGCATPFDRLWISSLTDKAIREGLENLKCGAEYDNLYYAAKARSEADWLVGINARKPSPLPPGGEHIRSDGCRHPHWRWYANATSKTSVLSPNPCSRFIYQQMEQREMKS